MNATKTIFNDLPELIPVPKEFIHKKGEVIIMIEDLEQTSNQKSLKDFYGVLKDFPERSPQGGFEQRVSL